MDALIEQLDTEIADLRAAWTDMQALYAKRLAEARELRAARDNWMSIATAAQATVRELRAENAQLREDYEHYERIVRFLPDQ